MLKKAMVRLHPITSEGELHANCKEKDDHQESRTRQEDRRKKTRCQETGCQENRRQEDRRQEDRRQESRRQETGCQEARIQENRYQEKIAPGAACPTEKEAEKSLEDSASFFLGAPWRSHKKKAAGNHPNCFGLGR
jgi:hypothetical protein